MSGIEREVIFIPRSSKTRDTLKLALAIPSLISIPELSSLGIVIIRLVTIATTYYSTVPTLGFKLKGKDNYP